MKIITLLLLPFLGFSQIKLQPKTFFDGKIQISIPVDLKQIDNPITEVRDYELLFVNNNNQILLSISYPSEPLNLNQFNAYKSFTIKGLKEDFPGIAITDSGVDKINERQIGFIESYQIIDGKTVYSSIYFSSVQGRIFKIHLEYAKEFQAQWKNISYDIIGTIKILWIPCG